MTTGRVTTMGQLWRLFEDYLDRQPFPPSQRRVASKLEMSPTAFGNWRGELSRMPEAENLARFAELINMPYERVVDAALHDSGYLPKPRVQLGEVRNLDGKVLRSAARDIGKPSRGQQDRDAVDAAGEPAVDDPEDMEPR